MKKRIVIVIAVFLILSCQKSQSGSQSQSSQRSNRIDSSETDSESIVSLLIGTWEDPDKIYFYYDFDSDGSFTVRMDNEVLSTGNYTLDETGDDPVLSFQSEDITFNHTMTIRSVDDKTLKYSKDNISGVLKWNRSDR